MYHISTVCYSSETEESRLGLGGGAVNFVRENDVGEDGAFDELKSAAPGRVRFLENVGAGDVGGHQVGRELNAVKLERHDLRERINDRRFGQTGNAHQEAVTAREDANEQLFDNRFLPDDYFADFGAHFGIGIAQLIDGGDIVVVGSNGFRISHRELAGATLIGWGGRSNTEPNLSIG